MSTSQDQDHVIPAQRSAGPDAPSAAPRSSPPAAAPARSRRALVIVTTFATVVVLMVAVALLGVQAIHRSQALRDQRDALTTARSYAQAITTYDYRNLDTSFAAVLAGATGTFAAQYSSGTGMLRDALTRDHSVSHGTVLDAGVAGQEGRQITVVLFVDQSVTNLTRPQPRVIRGRMLMTLVPEDGRWLASQVQLR